MADEIHNSLSSAINALDAAYPNCIIGHDGDIEDGGERSLVWETEEDAENDDGTKAVAEIRIERGI